MDKEQLKTKLDSILKRANLPKKTEEIAEMEKQTFEPTFWSDSQNASKIMKKITTLKKEKEDIEMMELLLDDNQFAEAEKLISKYEVLMFLSGPYDKGDAIFSIHAGQGGTEAMDWSSMLFRMYTRFFERKEWSYDEVDRIVGDEAGIKSTTINVSGTFTYGYLKCESGVHRLVRQSPFNADKLRQT